MSEPHKSILSDNGFDDILLHDVTKARLVAAGEDGSGNIRVTDGVQQTDVALLGGNYGSPGVNRGVLASLENAYYWDYAQDSVTFEKTYRLFKAGTPTPIASKTFSSPSGIADFKPCVTLNGAGTPIESFFESDGYFALDVVSLADRYFWFYYKAVDNGGVDGGGGALYDVHVLIRRFDVDASGNITEATPIEIDLGVSTNLIVTSPPTLNSVFRGATSSRTNAHLFFGFEQIYAVDMVDTYQHWKGFFISDSGEVTSVIDIDLNVDSLTYTGPVLPYLQLLDKGCVLLTRITGSDGGFDLYQYVFAFSDGTLVASAGSYASSGGIRDGEQFFGTKDHAYCLVNDVRSPGSTHFIGSDGNEFQIEAPAYSGPGPTPDIRALGDIFLMASKETMRILIGVAGIVFSPPTFTFELYHYDQDGNLFQYDFDPDYGFGELRVAGYSSIRRLQQLESWGAT